MDYSHLEATGKSIESKLIEKEKEIAYLRERDNTNADDISELKAMVNELMSAYKTLDKTAKQQVAENLIRNKLYSSSPKKVMWGSFLLFLKFPTRPHTDNQSFRMAQIPLS